LEDCRAGCFLNSELINEMAVLPAAAPDEEEVVVVVVIVTGERGDHP
jgi:hypothetical protein